ncbi:hypothetical protein C4J93_0467 [Pseudomonas sp. R2-37-08W]|nr:hypothetical protein C4J93_0467 [Pseudomonas sp. R2-37-08W]AZF40645.1 hypothetical protein C4J87_0456 [Pseudomonas sp. R1-43-08]AZF50960.1 hypothetical protein C4J85_0445 [Pseudomonas sp. R4-34-07]
MFLCSDGLSARYRWLTGKRCCLPRIYDWRFPRKAASR